MVRLHLGSGTKYLRDYINIDLGGKRVDRRLDIRKLDYADGSVDEILAVHVLEHFFLDHVPNILMEWHRVLKVGGKLIMEMPDLAKVLKFFGDPKAPLNFTYGAIYGGDFLTPEDNPTKDEDRLPHLHKWCWTFETLAPICEKVGFKCTEALVQYHVPQRDFRIVCVKE